MVKSRKITFNRKGLELSMSVLIMLIISIVIFSYSMYFLYNLMRETPAIERTLDQQTAQAIEQMLSQGTELVAIPYHSKTAEIGETVIYGLGVRNVNNDAKNFKIEMEFSKAFTQDMKIISNVDSRKMEEWLGTNKRLDLGSVKAKQLVKEPLGITVGEYISDTELTVPGIYIFTVKVLDSTTREVYGGVQEVNVKVE
ncbi:hypothetical protein HY837_02020 [archaeon]|nr:hypothetical protein [archaeon]